MSLDVAGYESGTPWPDRILAESAGYTASATGEEELDAESLWVVKGNIESGMVKARDRPSNGDGDPLHTAESGVCRH